MTISPSEAAATAAGLRAAAAAGGDEMLRQVREELLARADEWERAVTDCMEHAGEGAIEMVMSVTRGMRLYHDRYGWCRVLRRLNDGLSLHVESGDNPNGWYKNSMDPTSPVVVHV